VQSRKILEGLNFLLETWKNVERIALSACHERETNPLKLHEVTMPRVQ
jgi:hypothetical protein